jgi:hypothetical protein
MEKTSAKTSEKTSTWLALRKPAFRISIDFIKSVSFESAPVSIFSESLDQGRLPAPQDGPVSITAEFNVDPTRRNDCIELMREARLIFLRNGANRWHLYEDLNQANKFRMEIVVPWKRKFSTRELEPGDCPHKR